MKKQILAIVFGLLNVGAQSQLLYKIESKNGQHISYLYGTIHLMPEEQFKISPVLTQAFDQCRTLAMEVELKMSLSEQVALAKQTLLPNGQTLKDITQPVVYKTISSYCMDSCGMSKKKFKRYSHLKPFFLSSIMLKDQLKSTKSYEIEFGKMAEKGKKNTMGLESIQAQMETINAVSLSDQVRMLLDGLTKPQAYDSMVSAYLSEDLETLYHEIIAESEGFPDFIESFLNRRNQNWIPVITTLVEQEPTFIAVGAGHLAGTQGVISLLRQAGYTVTAVRQ